MEPGHYLEKSRLYLEKLCEEITDRSVGSTGNREATLFFESKISSFGWQTESSELQVIDWAENGATLRAGETPFTVQVSPYSLGCNLDGQLVSIATLDELEKAGLQGKIVLLHGDIAKEQLMPKNFVFYNPEEHRRIIALLESKMPAAIISATGRNAALAGGVYPFPLIEDGDFDIPSVYMTEEESLGLLPHTGKSVRLKSESGRIPSTAWNVIARKGRNAKERIVLTAHIDAKKGTPGAIDNATGVMVLLLVAEMLEDYQGERMLEIVALNGEDYYGVPGQMDYIGKNQNRFQEILLNINIDGAGYREGSSAFSPFGLPEKLQSLFNKLIAEHEEITEGVPWPQGDHSIFIQQGCPAIAVTSRWFLENMETQTITHTPADHPGIVDCRKLVTIARALDQFIRLCANAENE